MLYCCHSHELSNRHLKIAYSPWPPFIMVEKDARGGGWRCTGIVGELLNYIKQARNTTYTLVEEPNGVWGNCEHATNCTGMIGMVNRKEVDMALGLLNLQHSIAIS